MRHFCLEPRLIDPISGLQRASEDLEEDALIPPAGIALAVGNCTGHSFAPLPTAGHVAGDFDVVEDCNRTKRHSAVHIARKRHRAVANLSTLGLRWPVFSLAVNTRSRPEPQRAFRYKGTTAVRLSLRGRWPGRGSCQRAVREAKLFTTL